MAKAVIVGQVQTAAELLKWLQSLQTAGFNLDDINLISPDDDEMTTATLMTERLTDGSYVYDVALQ